MRYAYFAVALTIGCLYIWSVCGQRFSKLKSLVRTYGPCLAVIVLVLSASNGLKGNLPRVDFGMFYSTALLLRQDPGRLYDPTIQTEFLHAVTGLTGQKHYLPFAYPPFVALLFTPFTAVSFKSAYFLLLGLNGLLLVFTLRLLSRKLGYREDQTSTLLVAAGAMLPLYAALLLGHLTIVGLLLLSLFIIDLFNGHRWRAGLWTALLLYKPLFVPIPLLMLIWKKQWRAMLVYLTGSAILGGVSLLLVGWAGLEANFAMLKVMTSEYLLPRTQSLWRIIFWLGWGHIAWLVVVAAVISVLWAAIALHWEKHWTMAGAMLAILLIPPYLQYYDLALGLTAIACFIQALQPVSEKTRNVIFLLTIVPGTLVLLGSRELASFPIVPVFLFFCFGYLIWRAHRERRPLPGAESPEKLNH